MISQRIEAPLPCKYCGYIPVLERFWGKIYYKCGNKFCGGEEKDLAKKKWNEQQKL